MTTAIVLRTKATSLLNKRFGLLDGSFPYLYEAVQQELKTKEYLTADEFLSILDKFGVTCCYDPIPPQELQICVDLASFSSTGGCQFVPLLEFPDMRSLVA